LNVRIRYNKIVDGKTTSRRTFVTSAGREVVAELNLNDKKYRILDAVTGEEVASGGKTKNLSVLKIQTKNGLMALGVEFSDEERDREGRQRHDSGSATQVP
jgi:hypothetical protein